MMCRLALATLALLLWAGPGHAASLTARIRDTDYVRVTEWTKLQGLQLRWVKHDETFLLTNKTARLQLTVDSREARFNGLQLWLLYPLATRDGEIYISQLDVEATFRPFLAAPKYEPGKKIHTICLDAGHGGKDPGNQASGKREKDLTLRLAADLRDELRKMGFRVVFSRTSDRYVELSERPALARKYGADVFVSLHFNGTGGDRSAAQGSEVYALTPAGAASTNSRGEGAGSRAYTGNRNDARNLVLAGLVQRSLVRTLGTADRGVRRARFEVLREATMPAVLIEAGFLSHPTEGKKIFTAAYRKQMAQAIAEGIKSYKQAVER